MKNIFKLFFALILGSSLFLVSCEDDDTGISADVPLTLIPELENGVFIRFSDGFTPPSTLSYAVPEEAAFTVPLEDFNGNAVSYSLDLTATVSGNTIIAEDVYTVTSFPGDLTIDMPTIASALGLTLADINFGDNFDFIATASDEDGREFVGSLPNLNDDGTLALGNTNDPILNNPASFNSAMQLNFTLACPEFVTEDVIGTYDVTVSTFAAFFGETDFVREVVAGPEDNQVTIVGGEFPGLGSDDLIITFDPTTGSVLSINTDGISLPESAGFGINTYLLVDGLVLPCAGNGIIDLRLNFNPLSGNPHDFILEKQ